MAGVGCHWVLGGGSESPDAATGGGRAKCYFWRVLRKDGVFQKTSLNAAKNQGGVRLHLKRD